MILLVDNYDSFTYNIYDWLDAKQEEIRVVRNDQVKLEEIENKGVSHIILSPGPMGPKDAGMCCDIINKYAGKLPILGICLGHQCIGHVFGCEVDKHPFPTHGKASAIEIKPSVLYRNLPSRIDVGRYHSLHIKRQGFNEEELIVNSWMDDGTIMGIEHKHFPLFGVQFHPESILTGNENGRIILNNFLRLSPPGY